MGRDATRQQRRALNHSEWQEQTPLDFSYDLLTACVNNLQIHSRVWLARGAKGIRISGQVAAPSSMANLHHSLRGERGKACY